MAHTQTSLFSGLALKDVLEDHVLPEYHRIHAVTPRVVYEPTRILVDLITAGDVPDVIIGVHAALVGLAADQYLESGSITPLVRSGIGVAISPGASVPDISNLASFVDSLKAARSVAYSQTGASGIYFARLLDELGIATEINAKATIVEKGFAADALVDGRADLAIQQVIELASVDGVHIVGPVPAAVQEYVELSVGLAQEPTSPEQARSLYEFLTSDFACASYERAGLEVQTQSA